MPGGGNIIPGSGQINDRSGPLYHWSFLVSNGQTSTISFWWFSNDYSTAEHMAQDLLNQGYEKGGISSDGSTDLDNGDDTDDGEYDDGDEGDGEGDDGGDSA
jgi:hypothetical protein